MKQRATISFGPAVLICSLALASCGAPKYQRAEAPLPKQWAAPSPWRPGTPKDAIPKGEWWTVFRDERLNTLEAQALAANQSLAAAAARYQQARALTSLTLSTLFPQFSAAPLAERQRISGNRPPNSALTNLSPVTQNNFLLPFTVSYEADLFGGRRSSIRGAQAAVQEAAAQLENARLVVTAEMAADYFTLRRLDSELGILTRTVAALEKGLQLVQARHEGGIASGLDVAQEETLLETTRTQATLLREQRDSFEHAIAVLAGQPASDFHAPAQELTEEPPSLDAGLPSDLLERRPDIAAAERRMAEANAQVGVARSSFFPSINLFAGGGWQAAKIIQLMNVSSTLWAVGTSATESIFSGGARRARSRYAHAGYDAAVADYRQTVLNALRETEDDLSGLRVLNEARESQARAVDAARRALDIATNRYSGGLVSYLDVVSAQQTLLANERQAAQIEGRRLVASVLLVKALGGGWDASSLASARINPKARDMVQP